MSLSISNHGSAAGSKTRAMSFAMNATSRLVGVSLCVLGVLAVVPIFLVKLPPLVDYPNHLARMWIIARLPHDPALQHFYAIHWKLIPDLAMDLIIPWLIAPFGIWLAGKLFIAATVLITISGAAALGWTIHRRLSLTLLWVPVLLYSTLFLLGFLNFFFSVGVALWAASVALRLRHAPLGRRIGVNAAFATALYCFHLYGLGLYGLILLSYEAADWRSWRQNWLREAPGFCLPFVPAFLILLATTSHRTVASTAYSLTGKLTGLIFIFGGQDGLFVFTAAILFALAMIFKRRDVSAPRALLFFLGIGGIVWLAMPFVLFGSAYADARLPLLLVIVAVSMIDVRLSRRGVGLFCVSLMAIAVIRYGLIATSWRQDARVFAQFEQSFDAIPPGSRILTATTLSPKKPYSINDLWLIHMPSAAIIERSDFVTLEFTSPSGQVLRVHSRYQDMKPTSAAPVYIGRVVTETPNLKAENPSARGYWIGWRRKFDAIYLLNAPPGTPSPSPDMRLVYQGERFQLYRVVPRGAAG